MRIVCKAALVAVALSAAVGASGMTGLISATVVRTTAQVFGDALDESDATNGGFWTIAREASEVGTSSASLPGVNVASRSCMFTDPEIRIDSLVPGFMLIYR